MAAIESARACVYPIPRLRPSSSGQLHPRTGAPRTLPSPKDNPSLAADRAVGARPMLALLDLAGWIHALIASPREADGPYGGRPQRGQGRLNDTAGFDHYAFTTSPSALPPLRSAPRSGFSVPGLVAPHPGVSATRIVVVIRPLECCVNRPGFGAQDVKARSHERVQGVDPGFCKRAVPAFRQGQVGNEVSAMLEVPTTAQICAFLPGFDPRALHAPSIKGSDEPGAVKTSGLSRIASPRSSPAVRPLVR